MPDVVAIVVGLIALGGGVGIGWALRGGVPRGAVGEADLTRWLAQSDANAERMGHRPHNSVESYRLSRGYWLGYAQAYADALRTLHRGSGHPTVPCPCSMDRGID